MTESPEPTPETSSDVDADARSDDTATDDDVTNDALDPRTRESLRRLRAENKSLRGRLHSIESDYEAAASRLSALQHNEIERVASELLIDGRDIWRAEADVQAYVDEQFEGIIADKVIESAKQLLRDRPYLGRPPTGPPPTQRPSKACGVAPRPRKNRKRRPGTRRYAAAKLADRAHGPGAQRNTNAPGGEHVTALGG